MNRRERRYGRMYLLPLLLALTGMALLVLEWVLRAEGFEGFSELKQTMLRSSLSLLYPVVLLFLYVFRIQPKYARIFSIVSLCLSLIQLILIICCMKHPAQGLLSWMPGHGLLYHVSAQQTLQTTENLLLIWSDAAFVLSNLSAVFTCLVYAKVKISSDQRNAEFDRRNSYLTHSRPAPQADEPTRIAQVPAELLNAEKLED